MTPMQLILLAHLAFSQLPVCTFRFPQGALRGATLLPYCKANDILTDQGRVTAMRLNKKKEVTGVFQVPCRRVRPA